MAHRQLTLRDQVLHLPGQLQKTNVVGDRGPVFPGAMRDFFMGEAQLRMEPLERLGRFDGIQVLPLDVFHQGHFQQPLIPDGANDHGDSKQTRQLSRPPSPLPRHNLVAILDLSHQQGLQDAVGLDGLGQFVEFGLVKIAPRLKTIGLEQVDVDLPNAFLAAVTAPNQGAKPPPERLLCGGHARGSPLPVECNFPPRGSGRRTE